MVCQRIEKIRLKDNLIIEATFFTGEVKAFDVSSLFDEYPAYRLLAEDRSLWASAQLMPQGSGVYFNDDLDLTSEEIWENGKLIFKENPKARCLIAQQISMAREGRHITQMQLSRMTGISQCDISRIEGGVANPTIDTLAKICAILDLEIKLAAKS